MASGACGSAAAASARFFGPPVYVNTQNFAPHDGGSNSDFFFGYRVDVSDGKTVIGDPYFHDGKGNDVGGFAVYQYDPGRAEWVLEQHVVGLPDYRACSYQDISTDGSRVAIAGSVTKVLPPITPASPASAQPAPNTSMNTRGTLCPSASTMSAWVSEA